jgi:hypothetical protein
MILIWVKQHHGNHRLVNLTKYPLMTSNDDALQYVWSSNNKYPRPDNLGNNATRENMSKTYIDILKETTTSFVYQVRNC